MIDILHYNEKPIEPALLKEIYFKSYGVGLDYKNWEWRFLNNPVSNKIYINYIIINGVLASYLAASPVKIQIHERSYDMALLTMGMTHPEHQGKGYFTLLANDLIKRMKDDGFIGLLGFANQNSHYGFRKNLDWVDLSELNGFSADTLNFKGNLISENSVIDFTDSKIDLLLIRKVKELICSNQMIIPRRDESFLSWRLLKNPSNQYHALLLSVADKLIGAVLYKFYNGSIDIMEYFFAKNEVERNENLIKGISFLTKKYACSVNIWSNLFTEEHLTLEKYGFKKNNFITYFGIIPFMLKEQITDIRNWHYRFIDSDVF